MSSRQGTMCDCRWLVVILLVALGLRVGFVVWLHVKLDTRGQEYLIAGDAEGYWELAKSIVSGSDYAVHTPPRYVHRMPGFPAILAISIKLFGESLFAARLMLATLGAFSCWLVYVLGKRLHSPNVGLIAAALAAVAPASVGFSGLILSETAFTVAMLLTLICLHGLTTSLTDQLKVERLWPALRWASLTGGSIALGVYMKPSWILIGPLASLFLFLLIKPRRKSSAAAALIMLSLFLCLLPWGLRNKSVSGHFSLTTYWMGPSLYDGLNPQATGDSDMRFFDEDQLPLEFSEYEVDKEYRRRAVDFAKANPGRVVQLAGIKLWRYWKPWPNAEQFDKAIIRIGLCLYTLPVFLLAIIGGVRIRRQYWSIVICAGPIFYFSALHTIFVSSLRYRLPAEAPLMVLTAFGILSVMNRQKRSESK